MISADGFKVFVNQAGSFQNLTSIMFCNNKISDDGFKAFTDQVTNFKKLQSISIYSNNIQKE